MDSRLSELPLKEFLNQLASKSPVPGSGSVAALCGAMACSIAAMVCNLTIGKEGYEQTQLEIQNAKDQVEELGVRFVSLVQEDTDAFQRVTEAWNLPKETDEQQKLRQDSIQDEMRIAANVPLETLRCCERLAMALNTIAKLGSQNNLTDVATALHIARVAGMASSYNIRANLTGINDKKFVADSRNRLEKILHKIESIFRGTKRYLNSRLP